MHTRWKHFPLPTPTLNRNRTRSQPPGLVTRLKPLTPTCMLCVSIGRGRHRHMIAEHKHLVERGAKLVELRLDYINGDVNLKRLLADRPCPVIITCRRQVDGGRWAGTEQTRLLLLRTAIAEGCE